MGFFWSAFVSALILGAACCDQLNIPGVDAIVGEILIKAESSVHYRTRAAMDAIIYI